MKKFISMLLCLIMTVSVFTATVVPVYAAGIASNMLVVTDYGYAYDEITYKVSLKANQSKVTGVIVNAVYDPAVLEVIDCHAVGEPDSNGEIIPAVPGIHTNGPVYNNAGTYAMGYLSGNGYTVGSSNAGLFEITFRVISEDRLWTDVKFNCVEFITDDGNNSNDIEQSSSAQTFHEHSFHTLNVPEITEVNSYENALKVIWDETTGAENYYLYRVTAEEKKAAEDAGSDVPWVAIGGESGIGNVTSYIDTGIVKGTEYYYTLAASNSGGKTEYDLVGWEGLNFGSIETIAVAAEPNGNGAVITWSALDGADYYEVYRKLASAGESGWKLVKKVNSGSTLVDSSIGSGIVYNYKVRAFKENGKYSADMIAAVPSFKYISVPATTIRNTFDGIEIAFVPSYGAESFKVEKKIGSGEFAELFTVNAADIEGAQYSVVDKNVSAEGVYTYSVQAFSTELNSVRRELPSITRLSNTTLTDCKNNQKGVEISWNAVNNATEYIIYRKSEGSADFAEIATVKALKYVDTTARSGYEYIYSVAAKNSSGHGDYATNEKAITFLNTPIIKSVATINEGIKTEWYQVNGATSYNVYRKSATEDWKKVASNVEGTSFINLEKDIEHGVEYSYTVEATDGVYVSAKDPVGKQGMHFGVINSIKATAIDGGAYISWNKLDEADSYSIYRKNNNDSSWVLIAENVKNSYYEDKNMSSGVLYQYEVNAVKGNNVADMVVEPASAKYIKKPSGIAKNVNDGIEIRISEEIAGADKFVFEKFVNGKYIELATISANDRLVYVDTDVVAKQTYKYKIYALADADDNFGEVKSFGFETAEVKRIGAPEITSITNDIPGVLIEWEPVDDIFKYQILRKNGVDGEWYVLDYAEDEEFLDMEVDGGGNYYYTINAVTEDGGLSGYNEDGKGITFIETPDLIELKNTYAGVVFTWDSVPGAAQYIVYRRVSGGGWKNLGTVTGTTFTDKEALVGTKTYIYTARAVAEDGSRGYYDSGLSVKYMQAPKVTFANTGSGIQIKWGKISGAKQYYVYRKVSGSWKRIATTTKTSYTDTAVKKSAGKTYTYTVRAVNGSLASPFGSFTVKRLYTPTLSSAKSYKSGIQVVWKPVSGASGYYVYRKYGKKGWTKIATIKSGKTVKYVDKSAKKGTTYTYTVKAYSGTSTSAYNTKGLKCKDKY